MLKILLTPFNHKKYIFLVVATISLTAAAWWRYDQHLIFEQDKRQLEHQRIGAALRAGGANIQASLKDQGLPESDPMAPEEMTDQQEVAQALMWQKLSKVQRDAMLKTMTDAGLKNSQRQSE